MTPQDKAIELVDKMGFSIGYTIDNTSGQSTPIYKNQYAKQCALIAVQEIILSNPHSNPFNTDVYSTMSYWQEVKKEIENL
jgi:hypothetical protein